jgi:hypothetical protein
MYAKFLGGIYTCLHLGTLRQWADHHIVKYSNVTNVQVLNKSFTPNSGQCFFLSVQGIQENTIHTFLLKPLSVKSPSTDYKKL